MDLGRMLSLCERDQWRVSDLDFTGRPRPRDLPREKEERVVQLFTDMAGIEELAAALFREQERRATDPTLRAIFRTFVIDELRHATVAQRLANYYDAHRYREYRRDPALVAFTPYFLRVIRDLADDVANTYITTGELVLDVALLRTLNDHVADEMSAQAMALINRDESRHIAIDYHMMEHYASPEYRARREQAARVHRGLRARAAQAQAFTGMLYHAAPFFRAVFFEPMDAMDPAGRRLHEAFKRMQLLRDRPGLRELPFSRFLRALQDGFANPAIRALAGGLLCRAAGLPPRFLQNMTTEAEREQANRMSFDELAQEALSQKLEN